MKKLLYSLLVAPLLFGLAACSDDDKKAPDAEVNVQFSGVYTVPDNDILYAVEGDTVVVESVTVEKTGNDNAAIGPVNYVLNGFDLGTTPVAPFRFAIPTENLPIENNLLTISTNLLVVDHPLYVAVLQYKIKVVPDEASLPAGATYLEAPGEVDTQTLIKK